MSFIAKLVDLYQRRQPCRATIAELGHLVTSCPLTFASLAANSLKQWMVEFSCEALVVKYRRNPSNMLNKRRHRQCVSSHGDVAAVIFNLISDDAMYKTTIAQFRAGSTGAVGANGFYAGLNLSQGNCLLLFPDHLHVRKTFRRAITAEPGQFRTLPSIPNHA